VVEVLAREHHPFSERFVKASQNAAKELGAIDIATAARSPAGWAIDGQSRLSYLGPGRRKFLALRALARQLSGRGRRETGIGCRTTSDDPQT
jgi:hypothetical protein